MILQDAWSLAILQIARSLQLPDWAIGAGFVRALVWDHLSGQKRTKLSDIDVLYFDSDNLAKETEKTYEKALLEHRADIPWSLKNQARMHLNNTTRAYRNTEDAMHFWLETPTAVAVRLERDDTLTILAPFGLEDLFQMIIRPTPAALEKMDQFESRLRSKPWIDQWPSLTVVRE